LCEILRLLIIPLSCTSILVFIKIYQYNNILIELLLLNYLLKIILFIFYLSLLFLLYIFIYFLFILVYFSFLSLFRSLSAFLLLLT